MRWIVYGAGAVGGVLGGLLHEAGEDVVLAARGTHLDVVRPRGGRRVRRGSPCCSRSRATRRTRRSMTSRPR
ncbi:MAG: 2-dehydropantoate 2-reductase N-terminal domain-containing protein [Nocardioidaceae bacterium]